MTGTMTMTKLAGRTRGVAALTPGEQDVLELMASGLTNRSIAGQLWISPKTVEARISSIFRKLGLYDDIDENRRVMAVLAYLAHRAEIAALAPDPIAS